MRFGLAGAGEIGALRARALARLAGHELVAVADPDAVRAAGLGVPRFATAQDLLAAVELDALIVSTPPSAHAEVALAALEAGKHVLIEKPLAPEPEACRSILQAARARDLTVAVGFNQRYFPAIERVRTSIEAGEIGAVRHVRAYSGHPGPGEFHSQWESDPAVTGGGALMDNGSHLIDHVRALGGDFQSVEGVASDAAWPWEGEGVRDSDASVLLRSDDGRSAALSVSWSEHRGYRFWVEVVGERGLVRASYGPMFAFVTTVERPGEAPRTSRDFFPLIALKEKLSGWQTTVEETFVRELRDFIARISKQTVPAAEGFDGFRTVEIAHAVYVASETCSAVRLSNPF